MCVNKHVSKIMCLFVYQVCLCIKSRQIHTEQLIPIQSPLSHSSLSSGYSPELCHALEGVDLQRRDTLGRQIKGVTFRGARALVHQWSTSGVARKGAVAKLNCPWFGRSMGNGKKHQQQDGSCCETGAPAKSTSHDLLLKYKRQTLSAENAP